MSGVQMGPGATPLTRIFFSARALAIDLSRRLVFTSAALGLGAHEILLARPLSLVLRRLEILLLRFAHFGLQVKCGRLKRAPHRALGVSRAFHP